MEQSSDKPSAAGADKPTNPPAPPPPPPAVVAPPTPRPPVATPLVPSRTAPAMSPPPPPPAPVLQAPAQRAPAQAVQPPATPQTAASPRGIPRGSTPANVAATRIAPARVAPARVASAEVARRLKVGSTLRQPLGSSSRSVKRASAPRAAAELRAKRKLPSWLVSFVVHVALLLLLALIPIRRLASGPLSLMLGESSAPAMAEFELMGPSTVAPTMPWETTERTEMSELQPSELLREIEIREPTPRVAELEGSRPTTPLADIPHGLANGLTGRVGLNKQALLERYGGNAETEDAVELGLKWLAKQQKSQGNWSLTGPYSDGAVNENTTAATALAINAFLGAGYTNRPGEKYADVIRSGLAYLLKKQDADGFFSTREPSRQQMYAQALASIAVIEAYALTGDSKLRVAADRAVKFAEWSQSDLRGWRYEPQEDADTSVTGWFVMVLETAKMAGLEVDEQTLQNVHQFLDSVGTQDRSQYAYNAFERPSLTMTAEALLCRIMLGWNRTEPPLLKAINSDLLPNLPIDSDEPASIYYYYYATQVLHHVGGDAWTEWNDAMKRVFPKTQVKTGPEAGSWDPQIDIYASAGGRLYTTALHIYCLEVYYRHLSIYDLK